MVVDNAARRLWFCAQRTDPTVCVAESLVHAIYRDITAALLSLALNPPCRIYKVDLASFE